MTPARNNVRATRHFGIPARKSSPSAPLQPFPREKNSPGTPLQQFPREKVRPATASPWPNREKTLPARPKTPKSSHFSRAGRTFSRFQRRTTEQGEFSPATTPLNTHHRDTTTPTGRKLSLQHPPQGATGTKLSQQHPPQSPTGTKLSQHAQKQRKLAISRQQGELFPVPNTAPPSRENFLPQLHHSIPITGTPPPQPVENSPCNTRHKAQPVQNSPNNTRHKAQPVQNSPSTPKNNENWPFLASKENYFPFPTPHHRAGRIFSRNNTILGSLSTQLTGWSPLSPGTRPIHPSAGHCADY